MASPPRPISKPRPVWFNVSLLNLPLPGIVSILHRASGAVLFLFAIPLVLWLLESSLASSEGHARMKSYFAHPLAKLAVLGFLWAYFHHFCAGIRYLLLDIHRGIDLESARRSSVWVLAASIALTLIVGVRLW